MQGLNSMSETLPNLKKIWIQTALSLVGIVILFGLSWILFRGAIEAAGLWLGSVGGLAGVAGTVFLMDFLVVPASADIFFPLSIGQSWGNPWLLLPVMSLASMAGGLAAFLGGHSLRIWNVFHRFTRKFQEKGEALFEKYGFWAVVLGAVTPIPFSMTCWMAGHWKLPLSQLLLALLFRIPRMVVFYFAVLGGIQGLKYFGF